MTIEVDIKRRLTGLVSLDVGESLMSHEWKKESSGNKVLFIMHKSTESTTFDEYIFFVFFFFLFCFCFFV